jgi:predicted nucleic acid-binding protein
VVWDLPLPADPEGPTLISHAARLLKVSAYISASSSRRRGAQPSVYLETSVISYAVARRSRDLIVAAHQEITREWFSERSAGFDLFVCQVVIAEAAAGDEGAAQERLEFIASIPLLDVTDAAGELAKQLVMRGAVPKVAVEDALHIAVAATNGIEYLLTWNCKHIANASMRTSIEEVRREAGYEPPIICTPEELGNEGAS